jgi:YggT family protein
MTILIQLISLIANVLMILIMIWVISSWILQPYHPVRQALDRIVEPLVAPIRRLLPATGPVDFSPAILIMLIFLVVRILNSVLFSLR